MASQPRIGGSFVVGSDSAIRILEERLNNTDQGVYSLMLKLSMLENRVG